MATGWAEFLNWMRGQAATAGIDPDVAWERFRGLAVASEQVALPDLAVRFSRMPSRDRLTVAGVLASILGPVEWPREWQELRFKLVNALDDLLRETNALLPDSLPSVLALAGEHELDVVGWSVLQSARDLLRIPCRCDELRIVARLCNVGHTSCLTAYRRALKRLGERAAGEVIVDARRRYAVAVHKYVEAARKLNDAYGTVLFEGLDAPLGGSEP